MLDENLIATLEQSLRQTRNAQNRLMSRLREAENEVDLLRQEITALENSAAQTEQAIDSLLVTMRSGTRGRGLGRSLQITEDYSSPPPRQQSERNDLQFEPRPQSTVSYISQHRNVPSISNHLEALSNRFSDRTITQACTLLLREAGRPLHVNELYNMLMSGGMKFKGNNPTISIAVSLNRNRRFRKVDPGTFDLIIRDAAQTGT